jgi:hypothetical protein
MISFVSLSIALLFSLLWQKKNNEWIKLCYCYVIWTLST